MEKEKGSLEVSKLADLAVLSQDIFTVAPEQLPKTASILTMVGGAIVYDAHVLPVPGPRCESGEVAAPGSAVLRTGHSNVRIGGCHSRTSDDRSWPESGRSPVSTSVPNPASLRSTVTYRGADFSQMADLGDGGLRWVQILGSDNRGPKIRVLVVRFRPGHHQIKA
jgi:hypothetical protein